MITYSKRNGYHYEDETTGERFALVILNSLGGTTTTDIVGIWDEGNNRLCGWFYGATLLESDPKQLDELVPQYIQKPEQKAAQPVVSYSFNDRGVRAFIEDVEGEIYDTLEKDDPDWEKLKISVTIGNRTLSIPMFADVFDGLGYWLTEAEREWNG